MNKILSFGIPCYNSSAYMDHCISSILEGSDYAEDVQIIVVDDGSTKDDTLAKAQDWERRYPGIVKAVHQENGGHGIAVMKGLENAEGTYYKVVDSDDWVDADALKALLRQLRRFEELGTRVDLVISNYVYEHVEDGKQNYVSYEALPKNKIFTWDDIGHFSMSKYLLMHSLCYRADVLRDGGLPMPPHTFYVDNIYAYVPLPRCRTMYYADIDLYRYFIGREGQSVNEATMVKRLDQQFRVTRIMMNSFHLFDDIESSRLRSYMMGYFTMMMAICSVFTKLSDEEGADERLKQLWADLKEFDARMYRHARYGVLGFFTNLRGRAGEKTTVGIYHMASKIFKFN